MKLADPDGAEFGTTYAEVAQAEGDVGIVRIEFAEQPCRRAPRAEQLHHRREVMLVEAVVAEGGVGESVFGEGGQLFEGEKFHRTGSFRGGVQARLNPCPSARPGVATARVAKSRQRGPAARADGGAKTRQGAPLRAPGAEPLSEGTRTRAAARMGEGSSPEGPRPAKRRLGTL